MAIQKPNFSQNISPIQRVMSAAPPARQQEESGVEDFLSENAGAIGEILKTLLDRRAAEPVGPEPEMLDPQGLPHDDIIPVPPPTTGVLD